MPSYSFPRAVPPPPSCPAGCIQVVANVQACVTIGSVLGKQGQLDRLGRMAGVAARAVCCMWAVPASAFASSVLSRLPEHGY